MAPRLGLDAIARIDHQNGRVGVRGTGHHIAGVLLVPRGIGDDELALIGGEKPVGDVDGNALLALGGQAVDQQCQIELVALGTEFFRLGFDRGQLVFKQQL